MTMQSNLPVPDLTAITLSALDGSAPLGVCVLPSPRPNAARTVTYPTYIHEILQHAGLCYTIVPFADLATALAGLKILVTVGESTLPDAVADALIAWVEAGGCWLTIGGVCGLAEQLGVTPIPPSFGGFGGGIGTLGEGYVNVINDHPVIDHLPLLLHFFEGLPVQVTDAYVIADIHDAHQRPTQRVAITEKASGNGRTLLIAVDLPGTVVRMQQGVGITRDGVSAPDGTAPVGDAVLKSGDGGVLDWLLDRQPVPEVPGLDAYLEPLADLWRDLLLRAIFYLAEQSDTRLPLLWYYPRNLPGLAHLSHDTDNNVLAQGWRMLEVVGEAGINSTWCVILPGYDAELINAITAAGHELAMHYDSMSDDCPWDADLFHTQWLALSAMFNDVKPVSNKNHYLRWEGDCEFFEWCIAHNIEIDQSKGASKTGEAGFNFGTCHPYFPVDFGGKALNVLELTTPTQDLIVFAPPAILTPLLEAVLRYHGILHLLFHPSHIDKPGVADAILNAVAAAKAEGLEWWTAAAINRWERSRRQVRWLGYQSADGKAQVTLQSNAALADATILWSLPARASTAETVNHWGCNFQVAVTDVEANQPLLVQMKE
ncbi:MAG: hypothetical protein KDE58_26850 [Caldilineaceae bacterium]|nr:hypothetical protein [Caldilineaceae bacterium]